MDEKSIVEVEKIIGYTFKNKKLLITALTHSSFVNENKSCEDYEKLEFFGDSILNFIVAEGLYMTAIKDEGEMTVKRAKIVSKKPLCDAITEMGLYKYVRFGKGVVNTEKYSEKAKSDIFESVLAGIYVDSDGDMSVARKFVKTHLKTAISYASTDFKSKLQVYAQARKISLEYLKPTQDGEKHRPHFEAEVVLGGEIRGFGEGFSIKEAQQNAARQVLEKLNEI